jgi:Uma2 family endonuclease
MADPVAPLRMSAAEYLAWEREQSERHEFHLGEVFLMAGGSPRHNFIASACNGELRNALRGGDCGVLSSDQRVSAAPSERYVYPDVVVVCGPFEHEEGATDVLTNPSVIVEVLSRRTEKYDRGDKWQAYQRLSSLTDYLLVSQQTKRVEHYQRSGPTTWQYRVHADGEEVVLARGTRLSVDEIYRSAFDYPSE